MQHIPERSTELLTETKVADILTVSVWTLRAWWRENVYHGQGTLRRRRGNPAGLVLEGADGCGGRTGRESNRWQVRSR